MSLATPSVSTRSGARFVPFRVLMLSLKTQLFIFSFDGRRGTDRVSPGGIASTKVSTIDTVVKDRLLVPFRCIASHGSSIMSYPSPTEFLLLIW